MGNQPSAIPTPDAAVLTDDFVWPENLYLELRDMANIAFLVYTFAYLTDVAREFGLDGMLINDEGRIGMPTRELPRSFGPSEVVEIIENNLDKLKSRFQAFGDEDNYELLINKLKLLEGTTMNFHPFGKRHTIHHSFHHIFAQRELQNPVFTDH